MFTIPTQATVIGAASAMCGRLTAAIPITTTVDIRITTITGLTHVTILIIPEDSMAASTAPGDSTALLTVDSTARLTADFTEAVPSKAAAVFDLPVLAGEWEVAGSTEKPVRHRFRM